MSIKTTFPVIGSMPANKLAPELYVIAQENGLRLNRVVEFLQAARIFCQTKKG